ncbi:hypothetical protein HBI56_047250 [Parastagonospora nodorum]|uniref:Uncharacterized protein n=1 Tax=Phaeosphaeria nodorum (strain SN15 / ATCC MYA-4574 / FGSC 10173) TaxID=321614 RepID=A0A7U2EVL1_PHANO|nr:hypothetical protein HBH56_060160 [Parastagonospora nodorum]QRC91864.1 hypothetical protein JI435_020490 [Parastagonospora nodorum SN15]KAH3930914.1 hypothetical protein HBH54_104090 [Parastagonospora nodorum]KAH3954029.1 hypothetical protein HBH53_018770 [Parastagonospora nodorum]KAH3965358.1 hypothetical protein HBH51_152840 [Parastagonospora nodorum]
MGDHPSTMAEPHHTPDPDTAHGPIATVQAISSPAGSDDCKPLPIGSWILPFHGTCPRCHHYHKAVQVKIKITQDPNQASYIHCDNCKDPWAAFSARNSTQISLLSTATTEPDSIENEVRHKLIDIVKIATAKAALGSLDSSMAAVPLHQPSVSASEKDVPSKLSRSNDNGKVSEPARQRQSYKPITPISDSPLAPSEQRSTLSRLVSKVKTKIAARIPRLYRGHAVRSSEITKPPKMSAIKLDQPDVRSPLHVTIETVPTTSLFEMSQIQDSQGHQDTPALMPSTATNAKPAKLSEVATFIASLDASVLESMTEDERKRWMRKAYTDFKARNRRSIGLLGLSPIVENAIPGELPPLVARSNRRSDEVRYAGDHLEGYEHIQRRFSTSSDLNSDARSFSDDGTYFNTIVTAPGNPTQWHLHQLRHGNNTQRPQSMPSTPTSSRTHRRGRDSLDSRIFRAADSTLSLHGQAASLRSQGSITLNGSSLSVYQTLSESTVRPSQSQESLDLLPPPPNTVRDQSESPIPSPSPLRQSSDS